MGTSVPSLAVKYKDGGRACNPRWRLQVNELNLIRNGDAQADDGNTTREAVANWLWDIREERNAAP